MVKSKTSNDGSDGKEEALAMAIAQIEKRFGKGAIMRLGEVGSRMAVEVIPSGSLSLDLALGVGGIPRGRVSEIFGRESSGKSTVAYHIMAEAQKQGGVAVYIDAEHALDPAYAAKCGLNVKDLIISQPDTGEQALEIAEGLVRSRGVDVVVVDSVAALVPKAELEGDMGEPHMGLQARLMSQALRKLCGTICTSRTAVIFINQLREKIGGFPPGRIIEVTPGGRALKFYATVRIDLRTVQPLEDSSKHRIGSVVSAKVVKNKVAPPFREARFDIIFGEGVSREGEILDLGDSLGILSKKGNWYQWGEQALGQGREAARKFLKEHRDVTGQIEQLIRSQTVTPSFKMGDTAEYAVQKTGEQVELGNNHHDDAEAEAATEQLDDEA